MIVVVVVVGGAHSHWSPTDVTAAVLMKVPEVLMARSRVSTAPQGVNTGTSLGLKVRSAVVVHLAQDLNTEYHLAVRVSECLSVCPHLSVSTSYIV